MTEIANTPVPSDLPSAVPSNASDGGNAAFQAMCTDAVLGGRAMSSGEFLAGLIAVGMLETVGRPDKLAADLFPGVDPVVVQEIWNRALAVGLYAGRVSSAPRLYRDQMLRAQEDFAAVGFHAMAGLGGRSLRLVAPESAAHPADGEDAAGHGAV
ncbi:hypothetical protein ACFV0T_26585 [Streptomyces sp. NPDC059582]|uniref:hypothetical protein n=1 Tax=Streptomyces sp. NPDC059582 TaxID=3346875 RepID=UPI00369F0595